MSKEKDKPVETTIEHKTEFKPCFIITPIGEAGSEINIKARGLIETVITPELEKHNFIPIPAYKIPDQGDINKQVIEHILYDELVIANLTGLNPNVMYELAVRHAAGLPIIMMCERTTKLPFDLIPQRTIFYDDTLAGSLAVRKELDEVLVAALTPGKTFDNPISRVTQERSIIKSESTRTGIKFDQYLINRLDSIESSLSKNMNINYKINPSIIYELKVEYIGNENKDGIQFKLIPVLELLHLKIVYIKQMDEKTFTIKCHGNIERIVSDDALNDCFVEKDFKLISLTRI